jgi:cation-transporting P-type ATPase E
MEIEAFVASYQGLTSAQVAERVRHGQSNDFEARSGRTYWQIARDNIFNVFNFVLFSLLLVVTLAQDYATVFFAGFSVLTNSLLGMIQEISAKRKLDSMAALAAREVQVYRDGQLVTIPMKQVVLDDEIYLEPGDRVVVDGVVLHSDAFEVDESQLTGESDAIFKQPGDPITSGSFCVAGSGVMKATKVGADTAINKLSAIAKAYRNVLTPTQKKIAAIVEITIVGMFILSPMLFIASLIRGEAGLDAVRNLVVFITSLVPQGLVLVATLSLTIGAVRISRHKTLIQRVNAVESMANVTVLCFDKTGTLTQNKLKVVEIIPLNGSAPEMVLAELKGYTDSLSHLNSTARAVANFVAEAPTSELVKVREIPFSSARKWGAVEFDGHTLVLGAPERLIADPEATRKSHELSSMGMRVLGFTAVDQLPEGNSLNGTGRPLALIVMSDQVREDIGETLAQFRDLDVGLKVISGDNIETVRAIAGQAGMDTTYAYTGDQIEDMEEAEFESAVSKGSVFARIEPQTKQKIVKALQRNGQYVAMVGDGVNDVPALKASNLAIVMNDGTQISKDVADIVLLNNAMSTLPRAFFEGREITQTIFGTTKMFMARNIYNILLFIFVGFMMLPFPITPVQMSWASFGTVNMPATFIAFGIIRPKFIKDFRRDVVDYLVVCGVVGAVVLATLFALTYAMNNQNLHVARGIMTQFICLFGVLIVWNVQGVDVAEPSTFRRNWRVVVISTVAGLLTMISFYMFPDLLRYTPPDPGTRGGLGAILLCAAMFPLTMILISRGMRYRGLINRMWSLLGIPNPDDDIRPLPAAAGNAALAADEVYRSTKEIRAIQLEEAQNQTAH